MPRLGNNDRGRALAWLIDGVSHSEIARRLGVSQSTISRLCKRVRDTGNVTDRPRSGRPRATTPREDRAIRLAHLRDRSRTAVQSANSFPRRISEKTIRNRLRHFGIRARRPYVGLPLTDRRRGVRLNWLQRFGPHRFSMRQWRKVLFTDESRFTLQRADGRKRVYRRRGERYADACVVERDRFGGGSVMVWGGIAYGHKMPLIVINGNLNAVQYRDRILSTVAPYVQQHQLTLQQDNARPHVARICRDYLQAQHVDPLEWPPYSPDLSPIEHLWDEIDRRIRRRPQAPQNLQQLTDAIIEEWDRLPQRKINTLVLSMHKRIRAATLARGGHTRY